MRILPAWEARMGACETNSDRRRPGLLAARSCAGPHRRQGRSSSLGCGRSTLTPAAAGVHSQQREGTQAPPLRLKGLLHCTLDRTRPHGCGNSDSRRDQALHRLLIRRTTPETDQGHLDDDTRCCFGSVSDLFPCLVLFEPVTLRRRLSRTRITIRRCSSYSR